MKMLDPVCGMDVLVEAETPRAEYEGQNYYFCSVECLDKFQADPAFQVQKLVHL